MLSELPQVFGKYPIARQWIPMGVPKRGTAPIPLDGLAPRPGKLVTKVDKILIGDIGYRGLTAQAAADDRAQAYGHLIVDDTNIIECVPALTSGVGLVEQAHFVRARPGQAVNADESAIAVNLCFGGRIKPKDTYDRCVGLVAYICDRFSLAPSAVIAARDLDPARIDPDEPLKAAGRDFDTLTASVGEMVRKAQEARRAKQPARPQ